MTLMHVFLFSVGVFFLFTVALGHSPWLRLAARSSCRLPAVVLSARGVVEHTVKEKRYPKTSFVWGSFVLGNPYAVPQIQALLSCLRSHLYYKCTVCSGSITYLPQSLRSVQ